MVPISIVCVGMDQDVERSSIDDEPAKESAGLMRGLGLNLKHRSRVRTYGPIPYAIEGKFRELGGDALMELESMLDVDWVGWHKVHMEVEPVTRGQNWGWECLVRRRTGFVWL